LGAPVTLGAVLSGALAPDRVSQGKVVPGEGQTKSDPKTPSRDTMKNQSPRPDKGNRGPPSGARPGRGARRRASGDRAWIHGARPGQARKDNVESPPCGLTTCAESHWGWVHCIPGGRQKRGPARADPRHRRLVLGTWNVTSLAGKEPELVREVERYQLDMVGLTSMHSTGSGTKLLERGWTLSFSRVAQGVRRQAGVGILASPRLSAAVLEFLPVNERVASMRLLVAGGKALTVVCAYY